MSLKDESADEVLDYYRGLVIDHDPDYVGYSEPTTKAAVLREARKIPGRVVDLGSGPNPVVPIALAADGREVTCVELSENFAETARANARGRVHVVTAAAHETGLPDGCAGVVLMSEVLEHVPDELELPTLGEARRLLTGEGRLIITVPNASSWFHRYQDLRNGSKEIHPQHLRNYTFATLRRSLLSAGFTQMRAVRVLATDQSFRRHKSGWLIDRVTLRPEWGKKVMFVAS